MEEGPEFVWNSDGRQDASPLTIAEDVQLMLKLHPGRLEYAPTVPAAGALIELALAGRLSSVAKTGFFSEPGGRLLTVIDTEPTGNSILDVALESLAGREKPWRAQRAILAVYVPVMAAVCESLEGRGLARAAGMPGGRRSTISVLDPDRVEARRAVLSRARTLPDTVDDPRLGAVVDLLRSSGDRFRGETGLHPRLTRDWYSSEATPTIQAILDGEGFLNESS